MPELECLVGVSFVVAGTGKEENCNVTFSQSMGVCVQMDKNIFGTDTQAGTHTHFSLTHTVINNYSPKWRWLAVDTYRAAKP